MELAVEHAAVAVGAALLALAAILALARPRGAQRGPVSLDHLGEPRSFCFRDGYLVSPERGTGFLLSRPVNRLAAWDELRAALADLIPGVEAAMDALARTGESFRIEGRMGRDRLHLLGLRDGEELRITLAAADEAQDSIRIDVPILAALEAENALLQQSHAAAPGLAWVLDEEGRVIWANGRYMAEVERRLGPGPAAGWPIPALFPGHHDAPDGPARRRLGAGAPGGDAADPDGTDSWFEVTMAPPEGGLRHAFAQPLGRLIEAEENLRRFIDTLTRTFTALPTGLAIFDRRRALVMFNPPLLEMTGLDGAWLAGRPHLADVLDALRERQRLPEPRDWRAWRDALVATGSGEAREDWHETWTLATGQSLRMTARPQADGAVAILLEDVTAEMSLARRRRSDGDALAALLDAGDDAAAAFGPDGAALHLNVRMRELCGFEADAPPSLDAFLARLATLCAPSPLWGEIRDLGRGGAEPRADWTETLAHACGEPLEAHVLPIPDRRLALRICGDFSRLGGFRRGATLRDVAGALGSAAAADEGERRAVGQS